MIRCIESGAGSRIRTDDLLITNQLLYQLSYAGLPRMAFYSIFTGFSRVGSKIPHTAS